MQMEADTEPQFDHQHLDPKMQEEEVPKSPPTQNKKAKKRKIERIPVAEQEKREEIHAKIKLIHEQRDKIPPILAYFPSGYNPVIKTQQAQECENDRKPNKNREPPRIKVYRNKNENKSKRLQVVVSPPRSNVEFVGSNYAGEGATRQVCVYTLGILDKETQTLKIVPIASNKIFRLEPRIGGLGLADKEPSSVSVKTELSAEQKADRMRQLTNLYGTKKSINQAKKMHALNQEDDPESQKVLDRKIMEAEIKKEALESTSAHVARNIPPHDTSATTPQEAYPLDKIILKGDWDFLEDIYKLLQVGEVTSNAYPTYVCNRINDLREVKDEAKKRTLSCIFSFITHLIKFKDQHSLDGFSSAKDHRIPNILRQRFLSMFADPESKRLQVDKVNLLISYVLVLTLYADGFRTNPLDIAKDLRMSSVILRSHYENLGCKLAREKRLLLATLPIPLKFPAAIRQRRRRGL